ncbi:MAG: hypothetical protein AAGC55_30980 [Myxococcota bacterium]
MELVYKYRQLVGRCDAGIGLDFDGIDALMTLEALFAPMDPQQQEPDRERVSITGYLRNESLDDRVLLVSLGPNGCQCRQAPYAEEGDTVELIISDRARSLSYRFKAVVTGLRDDVNDDFALDLDFVGLPLLVHYGSCSELEHSNQIAA